MLIKLELTSEIPIYMQIRNQIILGLGSGKLGYGELLPSARVLADSLGVNFMTVNKAYNLLKQEGVIVVDRTIGTKISDKIEHGLDEDYNDRIRILLAEGMIKSPDHKALRRQIQEILDEFIEEEK